MRLPLFFLFYLFFSVTACGYTEVHEAVLRAPSPPTSRVELYVGDQLPPRPFYEVALVQAMGYGSEAQIEDLSQALESRGRQLGCDALVRTRFDLGHSMAHGYGVCVKWSDAASSTVQTTAPATGAPKE
jgi:hypothetical protein